MEQIDYTYINNEQFNETLDKDLLKQGEGVKVLSKIMLEHETESSLIININHKADKTISVVKIRAVLKDSSKLKILGDLLIEKQANDCDAFFEAKILILGNKARAIALPQLRINNKNVKAKHAVVIKKISDQDFFFLASRGINRSKAEKIISEGFLNF